MNPASFREAKKLFGATKKAAEKYQAVSVVVAPPAVFLRDLRTAYKGKRLAFGAQNASYEQSGAHTGELSLAQLKDAGASLLIVGHGERRAMGETDDDARKKIDAALAMKLTPVLCVGERTRDSESAHFDVVREQLRKGFAGVKPEDLKRLYVMYEPLWAVGTGKPVAPRDMHEMEIFIRKTVVDMKGSLGMSLRILYGGSVTADNARAMLDEAGVAGFIVGGGSLDPKAFTLLLQTIATKA